MSAVIKLCAAVVRHHVGRDDAEAEPWRLLAVAARVEIDQLRRATARALEDWRELRAENDRLKASRLPDVEYARLDTMWQELVRERDEARAEVERWRTASCAKAEVKP